MKSKTTIYLLIIGVLVVWGIILWKIFLPKGELSHIATVAGREEVAAKSADTLMLNYRDPFLETMPARKTAIANTPEKKALPATEPSPEPVEHRLRYIGKITKEGMEHALVEINGTLYTMKTGEAEENYKLNEIHEDSVWMLWKGVRCGAARY